MGSSGTSSSTQNTSQESQTDTQPWGPTVKPFKDIIGQIKTQIPNTAVTGNETGALNTLLQNAQAGNPFTGQIQSLANDLFSGGTDRTGMVSDAYSNYQQQAQPYLGADYLDPAKNPHFNAYTTQLADNAANRVNSMFAGAGRDMSGAHMKTLGQGITEATLPVFANQYNQNVATQRGVMEGLLGGAQSSAGVLSGMDQTKLGNRAMGIGAGEAALSANNYGANSILEAEAMRRGIPLQNIGNVSNLLLPIAGLGGTSQSSGTATSQGTQTMSPAQTFATWTSGIGNLFPKYKVA